MKKIIWFDMDGTIADLYGVENWLDMLIKENDRPYKIAKPLINMQVFARRLNSLQTMGYQIGVISWLSKNATHEYNIRVTRAKKQWLKCHLKSVNFDYIDIVPYGTPKYKGRNGILFDDEKHNRDLWNGLAFDEKNILTILKGLTQC